MTVLPGQMSYDAFSKTAAPVRDALLALGRSVDETGLDKGLTELVKLRASQINGCAFCVQLHINVARRLGIAQAKLDLVAAWREAGVFSPREAAALAWTEVLTRLADAPALAAARVGLEPHFSEEEALYLTVAIGTINQWNRIAIALGFPPQVERPAEQGAA